MAPNPLSTDSRAGLSLPPAPPRHRLPDTRPAVTRHTEITWYDYDEVGRPATKRTSDLYVSAGFTAHGELAEVFARIDRAGSMLGVVVDAWATAVSIGLQHGIPAEALIGKFVGVGSGGPSTQDFATSDPHIPKCRGPVDYIARWLLSKAAGRRVQ